MTAPRPAAVGGDRRCAARPEARHPQLRPERRPPGRGHRAGPARGPILDEAQATGGDLLKLTHLFGISDPAAIRYCAELGLIDEAIRLPAT